MSAAIGILGGMGPLATVDFIQKIIDQTPAGCDQEHVPLIVHAVPQIPDRSSCLIRQGESPLPALLQGVNTLVGAGVGCIAIACNTAYYWYEALAATSSVPILHIAAACADHLAADGVQQVALMATDGTLRAGFYPSVLARRGIELTLPSAAVQADIMAGIYCVKGGELQRGAELLEQSFNRLLAQGVEKVILGCTEIPVALQRGSAQSLAHGLDSTQALAAACVQWHRQQTPRVAA